MTVVYLVSFKDDTTPFGLRWTKTQADSFVHQLSAAREADGVTCQDFEIQPVTLPSFLDYIKEKYPNLPDYRNTYYDPATIDTDALGGELLLWAYLTTDDSFDPIEHAQYILSDPEGFFRKVKGATEKFRATLLAFHAIDN